MKKTTIWLTLGLLVINPLTPAATNNLHDDLAKLESAVISKIEKK